MLGRGLGGCIKIERKPFTPRVLDIIKGDGAEVFWAFCNRDLGNSA